MAINAIKIRKLFYCAKTLDSLSYRKIRLKVRKGFWVVWYMKRVRRRGEGKGGGGLVGANIWVGWEGNKKILWNKYTPKAKLILFCRFWLALIPRLLLRNQPALTKFGRCEQYTIDSMVYLIITRLIKKRSYMGNRSSINLTSRRGRQTVYIFTNQLKNGVHVFPKKKWLILRLKPNRRNSRKHKTFCWMDVIYILGVSRRKQI